MPREKWSAARLAYTEAQRRQIMACIQRLNARESAALKAAQFPCGSRLLPRPYVRQQLRAWFYERWLYLINEYEKVLPHVENLP